jgi:glucoamylase
VNSILTSIHNFDVEAGCDDTTFQPCSPRALANHKTVTDSFRAVYAINSDRPKGTACAVGRYAEDVFYDGNPWYLATLAGAEQLYAALISWKNVGSISVTPVSLAFFTDLVPGIAAGTYASGSTTYNTIISAVQIYADEYVAIVAEYTPADHSLAEQFLKIGGAPTSAKHLTWSYAALLSAADRREGAVPESWGAAGASLPSACSATSIVGSYASATATNLPATLVTGSPAPAPTTTSCGVVLVKFSAKVTTSYGQTLKLVGSTPALGAWDVYAAPALSAAAYTSTDPVWSVTVALKPSTTFEYKYVIVNSDGSVGWESDPNRAYTVPKACGSYSHSDTWR